MLDILESGSSSKLIVKNKATMTSMGMMYPYLAPTHDSIGGKNVGYFILAWASALLVRLLRAMPEPQDVGRATRDSHVFFMY